jgi:hypothetical protein
MFIAVDSTDTCHVLVASSGLFRLWLVFFRDNIRRLIPLGSEYDVVRPKELQVGIISQQDFETCFYLFLMFRSIYLCDIQQANELIEG